MSKFTELSEVSFKTDMLNSFERMELQEIKAPQYQAGSAGSEIDLSYRSDTLDKFLDAKNSYVEVKFTALNATPTPDVAFVSNDAVVHPQLGAAVFSSYRIEVNDVVVDKIDTSPERVFAVKAMYKPKDWLETYGKRAGMFICPSYNDDEDGVNTRDITDVAHIGATIKYTDAGRELIKWSDNLLVASGGAVKLEIPLALLSDFFDYSPGENQLMPIRSIRFTGTRAADSNYIKIRLTGHSLAISNFEVRMHLAWIYPSPHDMEAFISSSKSVDMVYSRYNVQSEQTTGTSATTYQWNSQFTDPTRLFLMENYAGTGDDITFTTDARIEKLGTFSVEIDGVNKPFGTNKFVSGTNFTVSSGDWQVLYNEYLRQYAGCYDYSTAPPIDYHQFYYCGIIPIQLDDRLPGYGILPKNEVKRIDVQLAYTGVNPTNHVKIVEFTAQAKMNLETGELIVKNETR